MLMVPSRSRNTAGRRVCMAPSVAEWAIRGTGWQPVPRIPSEVVVIKLIVLVRRPGAEELTHHIEHGHAAGAQLGDDLVLVLDLFLQLLLLFAAWHRLDELARLIQMFAGKVGFVIGIGSG